MLGITLIVVGLIGLQVVKEQRRRQRDRDRTFNAVMLGLEERAKREGTFRGSYFDRQTN